MMKKTSREIVYSLLLKYSEYHYDTFQIVLFKDKNKKSLLNFFNNNDDLTVLQIKQDKIFQKEVPFSSLNKSIINLLFNCDAISLFDLSDYLELTDIYNSKTMKENNYKYLNVLPIFGKDSLSAAFFIYSSYNYQWQFKNINLNNFIDELLLALDNDYLMKIEDETDSNLYALKLNNKYFLSSDLSSELNKEQFVDTFDSSKHYLFLNKQISYLNGELLCFEKIGRSPIYDILEIQNIKLDNNYTIVYLYDDLIEDVELLKTIDQVMEKIDGLFGNYKLYKGNHGFILLFENKIKKSDYAYFAELNNIIIRLNEISFSYTITDLITYIELNKYFDLNDFKKYLNNLLIKKKDEVLNKYNSTKVLEAKIFNSANMKEELIFIKDLKKNYYDLKENKIKSLNAYLKIVIDEKRNYVVYLSDDLIFNDNKPFIKSLNIINKLIENNCKILVQSERAIKTLRKHINNIDHYLILSFDIGLPLILKYQSVAGIYLDNDQYNQLFMEDESTATGLIKYLCSNFKFVILKVEQSQIIKYHLDNLLLLI